jgi:hypothetical protein
MIKKGDRIRLTDYTVENRLPNWSHHYPQWIGGIEGEIISYHDNDCEVAFRKDDKEAICSISIRHFGLNEDDFRDFS